MLTSFYSEEELFAKGFRFVGERVKISRLASFYNPENISIGDFSRIDDFCVISAGEGGIDIGRNVHIAVYSFLIGKEKIRIGDFVNISSRVGIYSSSDDFSGEYMTNPTVDEKYTRVYSSPVIVDDHVVIGTGSVVLPGVTLGIGGGVGALSLVNRDCEAFKIYAGTPVHYIKDRSREMLKLAEKFYRDEGK